MLNSKAISFLWIVNVLVGAQQSFPCGIPKPKLNHLIVRGQTADPDDWPWHATILHRSSTNIPEYACGGTLIHQDFVLTAKHCTLNAGNGYPMSSRAITVQLGVRQLYEWNPNFQQHSVLRIHTLDGELWSDLRNDIAILALRTSVVFNDHVLPVCLEYRRVLEGQTGTVIGFGLTENNTLSQVLKMAEMPVIETGQCLRADRAGWGGMLDEGLFCAGFLNGTTVCNGDSGGGYHRKVGNVWYLAGIVSFALEREPGDNRCREDAYGAFTNVQRYLPWIRNVTGLSENEAKENYLPKVCGLRTSASEYPWVVPIYHWDQDPRYERWLHSATGEIISKRYVIRRAKFFTQYVDRRVRVMFGVSVIPNHVIDFTNHAYRNVLMNESVFHPDYDAATLMNDIVLLRLDRDVFFDDTVQPICLPVGANLGSGLPKKLTLVISTTVNYNQVVGALRGSKVPYSQCIAKFNRTAVEGDRKVCIRLNDGSANCMRVHMGAVYGNNERKSVLIGSNIRVDCGSGLHMFSNVTQHVDWILENMKP